MTTSPIAVPALRGFSNAFLYDQYRPSYPLEAVDNLLDHLHIKNVSRARIIELGAGTGIFSRLLAERNENYQILAIEPHDAMRGRLEAKALRGVTVLKGDAGSMPLEEGTADAVIAAQVGLIHFVTCHEVFPLLLG